MRAIGNLIWFILIGLWLALTHFVIGVALCCTVIGIPFGIQNFKIAGYVLRPFGYNLATDFDRHPIMNILWVVLGGWLFPLIYAIIGFVLCCTLIGIPFGKKCFKLAAIAFIPFGAMY